jgi:hypothetical protein
MNQADEPLLEYLMSTNIYQIEALGFSRDEVRRLRTDIDMCLDLGITGYRARLTLAWGDKALSRKLERLMRALRPIREPPPVTMEQMPLWEDQKP